MTRRNSGSSVRKSVSIMLALALLVMLVPAVAQTGSTAADSALRLWYDEPASQTAGLSDSNGVWQSATLPIGNGRIGANVYGELSAEHLTLNEETLWSGGRGSVGSYDGGNVSHSDSDWTSWVSAVKNGSGFDAEVLAGDSQYSSGYYDGYQALGDLYLTFSGAPSSVPSDYVRDLNLETGVASVSYTYGGTEYKREYFVSDTYNTAVARLTASAANSISLSVSMESKQSVTSNSASVSSGIGYITVYGTVSNNGLLHSTKIAVIPNGGSVSASGGTVTVSGATDVTVYITAATDYSTDHTDSSGSTDWYYRTGESASGLNTRVSGVLAAAVSAGYDTVYSEHEQTYTGQFGRVSIDLGQSCSKTTDALLSGYSSAGSAEKRYLEVLQYQYGRYLLISGSSANSQLPTTLQGIWNNNNSAPWYSDIHTNINVEMNYWLASAGNLNECLKPLINYMNAMYDAGNYTVTAYTDADTGMMMHTQNTPFGYTSPGWSISTWGWSPSASAWMLQNCYDYYEYSQDTELLRETLFPLMVKQCEMYRQLLETDSSGKYVFPIAYSPEHGDVTFGNTYEQSIIWQLFQDTIEAAYALGYAQNDTVYSPKGLTLEDIESIFANLKGIETGSNSVGSYIKEWYGESYYGQYGESDHRHISQLLGAYPGNMLTTEELKTAAANTLTLRGTNTVSGWSLAQRACTWAAVGNGESAYTYLKYVLTNGVMKNLWGYHSYGGYGGDGRAFQIDANYGYSAAVNEMLIQSNYGYIDLIPAIPSDWSAGSFSGLLAEGNFEVDCAWSSGSVRALSVTSGSGGSCTVEYTVPSGYVLYDTTAGAEVSYTSADGKVTFETVSGHTYSFLDSSSLPGSVTGLAYSVNPDGSVTITWTAEDGHTYRIYRKTK